MHFTQRSRRLQTVAVTGLAAVLVAAVAAGCSDDREANGSPGRPSIVASTDVWGAVAAAVAGDKAGVRSVYTSPDGDPHEFEATAQDTATISEADVVVENGADYDAYMDKAQKNPDAAVINAFDLYKSANPEAPTGEGQVNEHFFYNFAVVEAVAKDIAAALEKKDPTNRDAYSANATAFGQKIDGLEAKAAQIKASHAGDRVAQTEPLAAYLLREAGLVDATPSAFTDAVEAGNDPPAAAIATTEDLIDKREVKALLYNTQAVDETTKRLLAVAGSKNLPVVKISETLPQGVDDYIAWQTSNIDAIAAAVAR